MALRLVNPHLSKDKPTIKDYVVIDSSILDIDHYRVTFLYVREKAVY